MSTPDKKQLRQPTRNIMRKDLKIKKNIKKYKVLIIKVKIDQEIIRTMVVRRKVYKGVRFHVDGKLCSDFTNTN